MPEDLALGADWMKDAGCRGIDPEVMFPTPKDHVALAIARSFCRACIVTDECLEYALVNKIEHGVWGGHDEKERRRIVRRRLGYTAI